MLMNYYSDPRLGDALLPNDSMFLITLSGV